MSRHTTTGRWKLGFILSLNTALFWGVLPIALKILLDDMDPYTITWYRFLVAALVLGVFIVRKHGMSPFKKFCGRRIVWVLLAAVGVGSNYVLYLLGLNFLTPSTSQVVIQLAPMLLLLGGILFFKESFSGMQWLGFGIFVIGLALFFNQRLNDLLYRLTDFTLGVLLIVAAAMTWTVYALVQKQLLRVFASETILLFIYACGVVFFLAVSHPGQLLHLSRTSLLLLAFCALNTLVAYGSFAEALDHWEASRVGAVIAIVPLITVVAMRIGASIFPEYIDPENLNLLSIGGAVLVVIGSLTAAMGKATAIKTIRE